MVSKQAERRIIPPETEFDITEFCMTPLAFRKALDAKIIGQDRAKENLTRALIGHFSRLKAWHDRTDVPVVQKNHALLIGPGGTGKTLLVRTAATLIGVPYLAADANEFTETGYYGSDVAQVIPRLLKVAGSDKRQAECGIIHIDEVDKVAGHHGGGRDVSGLSVQEELLTLIQGEASVWFPYNISDILFVFTGAFSGLETITAQRIGKGGIGYSPIGKKKTEESEKEPSVEDFYKYGFSRQFIGRIPLRATLDPLREEDLFKILTLPDSPVIAAEIGEFSGQGITLTFTEGAYHAMARKAAAVRTNARALAEVVKKTTMCYFTSLPGTSITEFEITEAHVDDPEGMLETVLRREGTRKISKATGKVGEVSSRRQASTTQGHGIDAPLVRGEREEGEEWEGREELLAPAARQSRKNKRTPTIPETQEQYVAALRVRGGVREGLFVPAASYGIRNEISPSGIPRALTGLRKAIAEYGKSFKKSHGVTLNFDRNATEVLLGRVLDHPSQEVDRALYGRFGMYVPDKWRDTQKQKTLQVTHLGVVDPNGFFEKQTIK